MASVIRKIHAYLMVGEWSEAKSKQGDRELHSVIASERSERGNLFIYSTFRDCFGRFTPSQ